MSSEANRKLIKDYRKIRDSQKKNLIPGISAKPNENDVKEWTAIVEGPEGTLWEGGKFKLSLSFTDSYPNSPPKVKFVTPDIYHPNVYQNGDICLNIFDSAGWLPSFDVESILISIQQLLNDPNPDSPANKTASETYANNKAEYEKNVRECVKNSWKYLE